MNAIFYSAAAATLFSAPLLDSSATASEMTGESSRRPILPAPVVFNSTAGDGRPLRLMVRVGAEHDAPFLLDTGSPITIIDGSLQPKLGKPIGAAKIRWPTGFKGKARVYEAPTLYLSDTPLMTGDRVAICDLAPIPCPGGPFKGVLGTDCLKHYCIQLDFESHQLRFLNQTNLRPVDVGKSFQLSVSPGKVLLDENFFDAGTAKSQIDSGDLSDGAVVPKVFRQALLENHVATTNQMNTGTRVARFPNARFAGETYPDVLLAEEQGCGFIGLRFLARHLVTFDFPHRTLYLKRLGSPPSTAP